MRELLVVLGAMSAAVLWMCIVAPLTANVFGVPVRISPWRIDRRNQHLTRTQYVWSIGVLDLGIGMFLLGALWDLLETVLPHGDGFHITLHSIALRLLLCLLLGVGFGLWSAPRS